MSEPINLSPAQKGKDLEQAVRLIELSILQSSPHLNEKSFQIETNKIVTVDGVRHEIDVYVTVKISAVHSAIYIFECKNWNHPVDKNEVIVFTEKIAVLSAQTGFFVAKQFSASATSQAAKDSRLKLLEFSQPERFGSDSFAALHVFQLLGVRSMVSLRLRGWNGQPPVPMKMEETRVFVNGKESSLKQYGDDWTREMEANALRTLRSDQLPNGTHRASFEEERTFVPKEFIVNDKDVELVSNRVLLEFSVFHPPVLTEFDVKSRGRVITYVPIENGSNAIQFAFGKPLSDEESESKSLTMFVSHKPS
jgi:hypothetical protein